MTLQAVKDELERMAGSKGVRGCALVDAANGMVWLAHPASQADHPVWEAAVDYWRLHERQQAHFAELGALHVAAMYHTQAMLVIFSCSTEPELLLVTHADHGAVDWLAWQRRVRELGALVGTLR